MKAKVLAILCAALTVLLAGCGGKAPEETAQVDYNEYIYSRGLIAYTDEAWLFLRGSIGERYLTFLEPTLTAEQTVMCPRADCGHRDESCSAWMGSASVYAWQNRLYYLDYDGQGRIGLYRMELDGTGRTRLRDLPMTDDNSAWGCSKWIGGGYLVLDVYRQQEENQYDTLYLIPLEDPAAEPTVVFTEEGTDGSAGLGEYWLRGDWLFYSFRAVGEEQVGLRGYRISTGEDRLLLEQWLPRNELALRDNTLCWVEGTERLCQLDLDTGELRRSGETLAPVSSSYDAVFDDRFFYLCNWGDETTPEEEIGLFIYDDEGHLLQALPSKGGRNTLCYCLSTPDKVLFSNLSVDQFAPVCYLDKAAIAAGTAEFVFLSD